MAASAPRSLPAGRKLSALAGFVVFGLSPSWVDWQQSPDKRPQMIATYATGLVLFYYGLLGG
jgi:hypothetical protein